MRSYLFIGGAQGGINIPVANDQEAVQLPAGVKDMETYVRDRLSVSDIPITIYRHESLTRMQVLNRVVEHYKAWATNRPGGRR